MTTGLQLFFAAVMAAFVTELLSRRPLRRRNLLLAAAMIALSIAIAWVLSVSAS